MALGAWWLSAVALSGVSRCLLVPQMSLTVSQCPLVALGVPCCFTVSLCVAWWLAVCGGSQACLSASWGFSWWLSAVSLSVSQSPLVSLSVPCCPSVSLAVPLCPLLSLSIPRCLSVSHSVSRCPSVSLAVPRCLTMPLSRRSPPDSQPPVGAECSGVTAGPRCPGAEL